MANSPSHSEHNHSSNLPVEIIEKIIQNACTTYWCHPPTLSSIALTSHVLRVYANNARFSALFVIQGSYVPVEKVVKSIRRLVDVIKSGNTVSSGMPGILNFTTSLSLEFVGSHKDIMSGLSDGGLAYLFRSLFRQPIPWKPSQEYGLRMAVYRETTTIPVGDVWEDGFRNYVGIDWRCVSPDLVDAFVDLVKNSRLNSLLLECMRNVPRSIFEGSGIAILILSEVTVEAGLPAASVDNVKFPTLASPLQLLSLGSLSYSDISLNLYSDAPPPSYSDISLNLHSDAPHGGLLPSLLELSVAPSRCTDLTELRMALTNAPSLQMLDVQLYALFSISTRHSYIPYRKLPKLSRMRISTLANDHGLSLAICFLKAPDGVGNLRRLELILQGGIIHRMGATPILIEYKSMRLERLGAHLSLPSFNGLEVINVQLHVCQGFANPSSIQDELTAQITDKLQSLKKRLVVNDPVSSS
uniref:Uncharacterized protein n=1 Tax=Psilocybe cubensis TaxID=181762 RepID=A0A8H7XKE2_PSICU